MKKSQTNIIFFYIASRVRFFYFNTLYHFSYGLLLCNITNVINSRFFSSGCLWNKPPYKPFDIIYIDMKGLDALDIHYLYDEVVGSLELYQNYNGIVSLSSLHGNVCSGDSKYNLLFKRQFNFYFGGKREVIDLLGLIQESLKSVNLASFVDDIDFDKHVFITVDPREVEVSLGFWPKLPGSPGSGLSETKKVGWCEWGAVVLRRNPKPDSSASSLREARSIRKINSNITKRFYSSTPCSSFSDCEKDVKSPLFSSRSFASVSDLPSPSNNNSWLPPNNLVLYISGSDASKSPSEVDIILSIWPSSFKYDADVPALALRKHQHPQNIPQVPSSRCFGKERHTLYNAIKTIFKGWYSFLS